MRKEGGKAQVRGRLEPFSIEWRRPRGRWSAAPLFQGFGELEGGTGASLVFPGSGGLRAGGCSRGRNCSDHPSPVQDEVPCGMF